MRIILLIVKTRLFFITASFIQVIELPQNRGNIVLEYKEIERFMTKGNWTTFYQEGPAKFDGCLYFAGKYVDFVL